MIEFHFVHTGKRVINFKGAFNDGARIAILGASGAGKTTFLRLLARLEQVDQSDLKVANKPVIHPWSHEATLLHQHPVMFAHHSVQKTLNYAEKFKRSDVILPVNEWVKRLELEALLNQRCDQLSGGQAQRVALLRGLMTGRRWLLLDEAFSALDSKRVLAACEVIAEYCALTGAGLVVASHQDTPHRYLCNQAYVIDNLTGKVVPDIFSALQEQAAQVMKSTLVATVEAIENRFLKVNLGQQPIYVKPPQHWQAGGCRLTLLASDISLALGSDHRTSMVNRIHGRIIEMTTQATGALNVALEIEGQILNVTISHWSKERLGLTQGQAVYAEFKVGAVQWHGQLELPFQ